MSIAYTAVRVACDRCKATPVEELPWTDPYHRLAPDAGAARVRRRELQVVVHRGEVAGHEELRRGEVRHLRRLASSRRAAATAARKARCCAAPAERVRHRELLSACDDPCAAGLRCADHVGDCNPVCAQSTATGVCRRPCAQASDCPAGCGCSYGLCELPAAEECATGACGQRSTRGGNRVICLCDGG